MLVNDVMLELKNTSILLSFWNTLTFPGFLLLTFERREHFLKKNDYQLEIGLPRWR